MKFCLSFSLSPCARYCLLIGSQLTTWSQGNLHYIRLHFFSSIENFSAYCPVLRGSILLPPRHPSVFARMARWQLYGWVCFRHANGQFSVRNVSVKSKLQHPPSIPPSTPPLPGPKCRSNAPHLGPFRWSNVLTLGTFHRHINDRRTAETPSVVEQNLYKYSK